jgi:hypothetical protein
VHGKDLRHRRDLDNDRTFHEHVDAVARVDSNALIGNRNGNLSLNDKPLLTKLEREARFIDAFEEPWTERGVHPNCRSDDSSGRTVERSSVEHLQISASPLLRVSASSGSKR